MPNARLTAIITALILSAATGPGFADFSLDELQAIEQLIVSKDTAALGRYLAANPQLVRGDDPLARELRGFQSCYRTGRLDCFASAQVVKVVKEGNAPTPATIY